MLDSLVRVSRRVGSVRRNGTILGARRSEKRGARRCSDLLDSGPARQLPRPGTVARLVAGPGPIVPASGGARPPRQSRTDSLASNDFTYYFTFFSKSFSSFPHGTCSLSVSRKYSAFDGHYHRISAAVPSNTTHWRAARVGAVRTGRGSYPLRLAISTTNCTRRPWGRLPRLQCGGQRRPQLFKLSWSRFTRRY